MRYLLDTDVILWWLADPNKLSAKAKTIISERENKVYASSVSMGEMATKKEIGKLTIPINILAILQAENIEILPLQAAEGLGIIDLPKIHSDPFDRILIAQAKMNDLVFITKDKQIMQYPLDTISA